MNYLQLRRQGSTQAQQKRVNDLKLQIQRSMTHKKATTLYVAELKKPEGEKKLSAQQFRELVYDEFGAEIHQRKIQQEVAAGREGVSPLKMRPKRSNIDLAAPGKRF
jgi:hypothetical protein